MANDYEFDAHIEQLSRLYRIHLRFQKDLICLEQRKWKPKKY